MSPGFMVIGEAAIRASADFRRLTKALNRLHADLPRYRKDNAIQARRARRAEARANRRRPLIHNGRKP